MGLGRNSLWEFVVRKWFWLFEWHWHYAKAVCWVYIHASSFPSVIILSMSGHHRRGPFLSKSVWRITIHPVNHKDKRKIMKVENPSRMDPRRISGFAFIMTRVSYSLGRHARESGNIIPQKKIILDSPNTSNVESFLGTLLLWHKTLNISRSVRFRTTCFLISCCDWRQFLYFKVNKWPMEEK